MRPPSFISSDDEPHLGPRGKRWLRRRIRFYLAWAMRCCGHANPSRFWDQAFDHMCASSGSFLKWTDVDEYMGPDFSVGAWRIDETAALNLAMKVLDELESSDVTVRNKAIRELLADLSDSAGAPREPSAGELLGSAWRPRPRQPKVRSHRRAKGQRRR